MSYYYLISGLPTLTQEVDPSQIDYDDTFQLIHRNLNAEDLKPFRFLLYPNDIKNLLSVLFEEYHDLTPLPYRSPAVFPEDEISEYRFSRKNFPDFMNDFLTNNEDRFPAMTSAAMETLLMGGFYEEVSKSGNSFIINYFDFYKQLKGIIAAYNYNAQDFLSKPDIEDSDRLIGQVGPSRSPTATILKEYSFVEEMIEQFSQHDPIAMERFTDRIIWDYVEDQSKDSFSAEEVFAYTIKLLMKLRWSHLEPEQGDELFEKLHEKIENNVRSPKTPVI
jgi:hypothetical protein